MSKLTRLQARLVKVQARITEIEAAYPDLAKISSYSRGAAGVSTAYQPLQHVAAEYRALLDDQDALEDAIAELQGEASGEVYLAAPREVTS